MAFWPPEYCRLFAQKKADQGGSRAPQDPPPLAMPLRDICAVLCCVPNLCHSFFSTNQQQFFIICTPSVSWKIIYIKSDDRLLCETLSYNSIITSIPFLCRKCKHSKLKNKTYRELKYVFIIIICYHLLKVSESYFFYSQEKSTSFVFDNSLNLWSLLICHIEFVFLPVFLL